MIVPVSTDILRSSRALRIRVVPQVIVLMLVIRNGHVVTIQRTVALLHHDNTLVAIVVVLANLVIICNNAIAAIVVRICCKGCCYSSFLHFCGTFRGLILTARPQDEFPSGYLYYTLFYGRIAPCPKTQEFGIY